MKRKPMQRKRGEPAPKKPGPKPKPPSTRVVDRLAVRDLLQAIEADSPKPAEPLADSLGQIQVRSARDVLHGYNAGELVIISRAVLRRAIASLS